MRPRDFLELVARGRVDDVRRALAAAPELIAARGGANPDDEAPAEGSALHVAAYVGDAAMQSLLVEAGLDVDT